MPVKITFINFIFNILRFTEVFEKNVSKLPVVVVACPSFQLCSYKICILQEGKAIRS